MKGTPLFTTGQLVATPGAVELMTRHGVYPGGLVVRHVTGDWGDMPADDVAANDRSVVRGYGIVMSEYRLGPGPDNRIWVYTETDRSVTTLLLPEEY